jgi:hypothetical protein
MVRFFVAMMYYLTIPPELLYIYIISPSSLLPLFKWRGDSSRRIKTLFYPNIINMAHPREINLDLVSYRAYDDRIGSVSGLFSSTRSHKEIFVLSNVLIIFLNP